MKIEQLGPYRILRELGHGGMGTVYEGLNLQTDEPAAVKLLAAPLALEEGFRERFEAEIETLRKLNHPNIVRLFGFGQQDQYLFYAMELVDGNSLEQELERGRQFDWRDVTRIGIDTCRALRHAHDRGVIHRDIKPGNLLTAGGGQVKLSDFGIARLFGNTHLTSAGSVLGTAEYMAPEQAEGRPVSPRADLYSLGAVLYVLLARRPLFRGDSLPEVLRKQRLDKPDPLSDHAPDVPAMLEQVIAQLLEKDPERRIPNPSVLARQLEAMQRALSLKPDAEDTLTAGAETDSIGGRGSVVPAPAPLPPTRLIEDPPAEPPEARPPAPPPGDLAETKATSAFKNVAFNDLDKPETAEQQKPVTHFTPVAEEDLDRVEPQRQRHALISLQTWALIAGLIAVGLTVRYFLKEPSPKALYEKITSRTADGKITSLLEAEDDIERFLNLRLDPNDPRSDRIREFQKEIKLYRLERDFELHAKGRAATENLLPIQRAYLEAINYVRLDTERGMAKLQALIDLHNHRADISGPTGNCLELARRKLNQLQEQLDRRKAQQLDLLRDRLDHAQRIGPTDPDRARSIYRAVIELYQDKPWAAQPVGRAREKLAETADK